MASGFESLEMQKRVSSWVESRLGGTAMESKERAMRFLEEALELVQAEGLTFKEVIKLVIHVDDKEPGDTQQELGGTILTLLAYADSKEYILSACAELEIDRIEKAPPEKFRKRQAENARDGIGKPLEDL